MINFRYHVISIVAVLLALCVGIVVGSGLLGGPLLEDLENRASQIRESNQELRDLAEERLAVIGNQERFAAEVEPRLVDGVLAGAQVVIIDVADTDGDAVEALRGSVGLAGGEVVSSIHLHGRLALQGEVERDLLALAVASTSGDAEEVRADAARRLGARVASAVAGSPARLEQLLEQLEEGDFLSVERPARNEPAVPEGASVVFLGGGTDDPPFDVGSFAAELSGTMAAADVTVLVAEVSPGWGLVGSIREEATVRDEVATTTGAELYAGRIAAVLALAAARDGDVTHVGPGSDGEEILPPLTPDA